MQGGEILEYAYLGLFQKVFEWVLSKILDPVIRFVSNLLTTVLSWLFEEVLAPILFPVLKDALQFFVDLWMLIYSRFIYLLFSGILKLIDYLEKAFDVFIGLEDVTYTVEGHEISGTLVEVCLLYTSPGFPGMSTWTGYCPGKSAFPAALSSTTI